MKCVGVCASKVTRETGLWGLSLTLDADLFAGGCRVFDDLSARSVCSFTILDRVLAFRFQCMNFSWGPHHLAKCFIYFFWPPFAFSSACCFVCSSAFQPPESHAYNEILCELSNCMPYELPAPSAKWNLLQELARVSCRRLLFVSWIEKENRLFWQAKRSCFLYVLRSFFSSLNLWFCGCDAFRAILTNVQKIEDEKCLWNHYYLDSEPVSYTHLTLPTTAEV